MDLPPLESVDLARESLSRSGPDADPAGAMRELRDLLAERGLTHSAPNSRGERLLSAPPMNRRPMIAEELTPRRRLTSLFDRLRRRGRTAPTVQIPPPPERDRPGEKRPRRMGTGGRQAAAPAAGPYYRALAAGGPHHV